MRERIRCRIALPPGTPLLSVVYRTVCLLGALLALVSLGADLTWFSALWEFSRQPQRPTRKIRATPATRAGSWSQFAISWEVVGSCAPGDMHSPLSVNRDSLPGVIQAAAQKRTVTDCHDLGILLEPCRDGALPCAVPRRTPPTPRASKPRCGRMSRRAAGMSGFPVSSWKLHEGPVEE